ncbi:diiron oxygenase [Chitiniphilus purpureus]|uniref:Diiron oxygenase n=1 Tax=Chitiniphilus purpureus TaxID=2981137 RepID=A0ABY6DRZ9_9NEIS|nr:diiron oxygenase [Chitiniphilus sp. CD1]UXY17144.1 diiron oxygenase [Chitiniphilus sp. CD1]
MNREQLHQINARAHERTFHPAELEWPQSFPQEELDFISRMSFGETGHDYKAIAYITKELAQLAEIERHVSAVLTYVLSELQADDGPLADGFELHHALSCFAAEELQHANLFYRYVRLLSGRDFKYPENLFDMRVAPYQGPDSPYVKLAALCCSAYIGESVITVFERRARAMDPEMQFFFTRLLYLHGLDEARHIQLDHFVFDHVIPSLSPQEKRRMRQILDSTEALNTELAMRFEAHAKQHFEVDYTDGNPGHATQLKLTLAFRELVFGKQDICKVDDAMCDEQRQLIEDFSSSRCVHA